uniref:Uncharacterized protein n=1 Tax=uncultured marine microorganism HF4000_APKG10F13 TaxID=455557 RepID=B3TBR3_9ZZZZ|nr:hypothetical protein ALOHA_HF4000APKG10F13ctg1g5 [uncultured marine microorganism HF4000_APKG10F13]
MDIKVPNISIIITLVSFTLLLLLAASFFYPWYEWNYKEEARGKLLVDDRPPYNYWYDKSEGTVEYKLLDFSASITVDSETSSVNENYDSVDKLSSFMSTIVLINALALILSLGIFIISVMSYTGTLTFLEVTNLKRITQIAVALIVLFSVLNPFFFYVSFPSNAVNPVFSTATHGNSIYELSGVEESFTGNGTRISEPAEDCFSNNLLGCKITSDWKSATGWQISALTILPALCLVVLLRIFPFQISSGTSQPDKTPPPRPRM